MRFFVLFLAIFAFVASTVAVKDPICNLPHSANGNGIMTCLAYMPSWSYNADSNECVPFVYGGCGGNKNRFYSQEDCEEKCKE